MKRYIFIKKKKKISLPTDPHILRAVGNSKQRYF